MYCSQPDIISQGKSLTPEKFVHNKRNIRSLLKSLTSHLVVGEKVPVKDKETGEMKLAPRPLWTKKEIIAEFNQNLRTKGKGFFSDARSVAFYNDHFSGKRTYYYASADNPSEPFFLSHIDIDNHGSGSLAKSVEFLERLKAEFPIFRSLAWEVSTNGNGLHAPLIFHRGVRDASTINQLLSRLEQWLNKLARHWGYAADDIEHIEIKGRVPHFDIYRVGPGKGQFRMNDNVKAHQAGGCFCRLPLTLKMVEIENSPCIEVTSLGNLPNLERTSVPTGGSINVLNPEQRPAFQDFAAAVCGEDFAEKVGARNSVTSEDMGDFFLLLAFLTKYQTDDNRNDATRFAYWWGRLQTLGVINRAFCEKRFQVWRNWSTDRGLITWFDNEYVRPDREGKNGLCCRWTGSARFESLVFDFFQEREHRGGIWVGANWELALLPEQFWIRPVLKTRKTTAPMPSCDAVHAVTKPWERQTPHDEQNAENVFRGFWGDLDRRASECSASAEPAAKRGAGLKTSPELPMDRLTQARERERDGSETEKARGGRIEAFTDVLRRRARERGSQTASMVLRR